METSPERPIKLLLKADLEAQGFDLTDAQLRRLENAGKFPRRVKITERKHGWVDYEVEQLKHDRIAARDAAVAAAASPAAPEASPAEAPPAKPPKQRKPKRRPAERPARRKDQGGRKAKEATDAPAP